MLSIKSITLFLLSITILSKAQTTITHKTIVSPYFNHKIPKHDNVIYCSTFQMAWNKLKDELNGDVIFNPSIIIADSLNNGENAKKYINDKDYLISSGIATKKYIKELNKQLKKRFHNIFTPINDTPNSNDRIIYSFLYKKLKFKSEFEKIKSGLYFTDNTYAGKTVEAFGIEKYKESSGKHKRLKKQTHLYMHGNEFAVVIDTKNNNEQLILAEIEIDDSLNMKTAYSDIMMIVNSSPFPFRKKMKLKIPVVDFNIEKTYNKLTNKEIKNSSDYNIITEAKQSIKFKLNQKGAVVKSVAKIKRTKGVSFIGGGVEISFNRPFFIILKEKNAEYPYLIIWVANSKILKEKDID